MPRTLKTKMISKLSSTQRRRKLAEYIEEEGDPSLITCDHCFKHSLPCIVMSSTKSLKCASCALKGIKCVNVSWDSLDKTRADTKSQIEKDLQVMEGAMARIARNRKVLALAEKRAKSKAVCLLDELEEEEEKERKENGGFTEGELREASFDFSTFLGVSDGSDQVDWASLDVPGDSPLEVGESSGGST
jgi:hypothetical protein